MRRKATPAPPCPLCRGLINESCPGGGVRAGREGLANGGGAPHLLLLVYRSRECAEACGISWGLNKYKTGKSKLQDNAMIVFVEMQQRVLVWRISK